MIAFLLAVLIFALSAGIGATSAIAPDEIVDNFLEHISEVAAPAGNPTIPNSQNGNNNQSQPETVKITTTNQASDEQVEVAQAAVDSSPVLSEVDERNPIAQNAPSPEAGEPENTGQPADTPNENANSHPVDNAYSAQSNNLVFGGEIPANSHAASHLPTLPK